MADREFVLIGENTLEVAFVMEVNREMNEHDKLYGRFLPDQHNIGSITGLQGALDANSSAIVAEKERAEGVEGSLSNLATDSKTNLVSAINEVDLHADNNATNLSNHINDKSNPHDVTKAQVGLGNCDNTADIDKPISTATQTALDNITNGTTSIAYDNTTSGLSATTLQGAIDEIDGDLDNVEDLIPSTASSSNQLADKSYVDTADNSLQSQITANAGDIDIIEGKIPTQASTSNKLADKNFVNSSISTNTANFIGTFNSLAELEAYSGTITNNDYAFVVGTDSAGNTVYNRYKYTTATNPASWQFEYALNNSSFTANQWAAINSGATSTNIGQIATNTSAISGLSTSKQDKITATNKLASDLVDDNGQTNKFVTASEKAQISTNASDITALQSGKADKSTTYTKTEVDTIATGKANVGLDNLDSTGQMIVDSQNGTISNCILEIPQKIKLEITSDNKINEVLGSVNVEVRGNTYSEITTTVYPSNYTNIKGTSESNKYAVVAWVSGSGFIVIPVELVFSGSTEPSVSTFAFWFNTTDKYWYEYKTDTSVWEKKEYGWSYPLAIVEFDSNNKLRFAKDSNGNDMIFNGAGFIGHHAFVYPNVSGLTPQKFNADGTLKSGLRTNTSLAIIEMNQGQYNGYNRIIALIEGNPTNNAASYVEVDTRDDVISQSWVRQYIKNENIIVARTSTDGPIVDFIDGLYPPQTPLIEYNYDGTTVTDFTIRQPVRLATTEMLDKVQDQVDTNTTDIAGKQDTLVSGTNIKTINSTSVLGSGNFALADQSLSNLDSTGQMIVDSQNGTISNCILEIPQNLKLTLENNVLTLKAGSTVVLTGSTYTTSTNASDIARTLSLSQGRYYIWRDNSTTIASPRSISDVTSGTTPPETATINFGTFYNINDKYCYQYTSNGWVKRVELSYPLCIIDVDSNGVASFAKDSNGNDMIFNGAGFIGHHAFVYPNVKVLTANGLNTNNKLESLSGTVSSVQIVELSSGYSIIDIANAGNCSRRKAYKEVSVLDTMQGVQYLIPENKLYLYNNSTYSFITETPIISYAYNGTTVTDFTIRQPYEGARDLLTDNKQNLLTTITGYDSTATQTLKNVNGVLQWVTD